MLKIISCSTFRIPSPKRNGVCKQEIRKYVSPVREYGVQLDHFWAMNDTLMDVWLLIFNVDRDYIKKKDYKDMEEGINRLIEKMKGNVDIWIDGYSEDSRELYEIPEVISWVNHLTEHVSGLSYFLTTHKKASFLRIIQYINVKYEVVMDNVKRPNSRLGRQTVLDISTSKPFLNMLFTTLMFFVKNTNCH